MDKFNQIYLKILKETSLAQFPGGVFGSGPGNITTDPNIVAAMSSMVVDKKKRKKKIIKRPK